jgi:transcriptional regulator
MYLPVPFAQNDPAELFAHLATHPFATIVTVTAEGEPVVSHLPLLVDGTRQALRGHLARENPQLAQLAAGAAVLAIFHGPHGYVSPSAYVGEGPNVPTWNYVVVHVHGKARLVDEPALRGILSSMIACFDTSGWQLTRDEDYLGRSLAAIAGFEIAIERIEGKWKLSQNRSAEDRRGVVEYLARGDDASRALAALMRAKG